MKVMFSGDHHWDESSRWDECARVHKWMVEQAIERRVELFISGGDVYERASTPKERLAVAAWLQLMAEQCPVLIVRGNHDQHRDCLLLGRLQSRYPITVEESAAVHYLGPGTDKIAIAVVAWPERARILARARELGALCAPDPQAIAQDALRNVFRGLGEELRRWDGPRLAVGHFMVDGSVVSTGQPLIGSAMNVGLADLDLLGAELVLMSHIHKPQEWEHGGKHFAYAGSPYRTAFGETEDKSVIVVTTGYDVLPDAGVPLWERIKTPCAAMILLEDEWGQDAWLAPSGESWWVAGAHDVPAESIRGAEVRFRYAVEPDQRDAARAAASQVKSYLLAQHGAKSVQVEEYVRHVTTARAPEVAAAKGLRDKLRALWHVRGTTPEPERSARLLEMAGELEEQHP